MRSCFTVKWSWETSWDISYMLKMERRRGVKQMRTHIYIGKKNEKRNISRINFAIGEFYVARTSYIMNECTPGSRTLSVIPVTTFFFLFFCLWTCAYRYFYILSGCILFSRKKFPWSRKNKMNFIVIYSFSSINF